MRSPNLVKMVSGNFVGVVLLVEIIVVMMSGCRFEANGLSMDYYFRSCPILDPIMKNTVFGALQADPTLAAGLVRMHFHDCFVEGCDGSVLIDSTNDNTAEKDSPANLSLRGYEVIDAAKEQLERMCPGVVSCADILAMAARDAVIWAGGPMYEIPKGRKDGRRSRIEDTINLPAPTLNASGLITIFGKHGFTVEELVALSGAHTLGVASCVNFKKRLNDVDQNMDADFAKTLSKTCSSGDNAQQPFDATRNSFDNLYFNTLQRKAGLLTSDQTLFADSRTSGAVNGFALNQAMFFLSFQRAMLKMGALDVKDAPDGEVRKNCHKIN
ncbi:peroxidase 47-like isoform X1 [Corylus avellana]|uniref:peroxidase 47-like isoform X1 n=1 Tax=Corylus avellana TaxID=13451 RepID=UPI00286AC45A|nr:peroxidase 47-like isoform X1 [Corylus avellana]